MQQTCQLCDAADDACRVATQTLSGTNARILGKATNEKVKYVYIHTYMNMYIYIYVMFGFGRNMKYRQVGFRSLLLKVNQIISTTSDFVFDANFSLFGPLNILGMG